MSETMDLDSSQRYKNQHFISELERAYHLIEKFPSALLSLSIKCKNLKLKDNGFHDSKPKPCFFDPKFIDVQRYPTNFDAEDDCYDHQQGVYSMIGSYTEDPQPANKVSVLCYEVVWDFDTQERERRMMKTTFAY